MTDTCPDCERLREAIDEPLLVRGYLPTETIEGSEDKIAVRLRKDRREPSAPFLAKTILISEVLGSFPGYELVDTERPTPSSVAWVLRRKDGE